MAEYQPAVSFGGIVGLQTCWLVLTCGVKPSRAVLTTPIIDQSPPPIGNLVVQYGLSTLTLSGCVPVESNVRGEGDGQTLEIIVEDRRRKWALCEIVGRYNVRRGHDENGLAKVKFEKTPRELVTMLAVKMGEPTMDVSALPNDARPYVDWTNSRCDLEMAALCEALGCDVAPDLLTGGFKIVKLGEGENLPADDTAEFSGGALTYPLTPDRIQVATAPVQYEVLIELEAVGLEPDGSWPKIDDLSYKPGVGWITKHFDRLVTGTYTDEETGATLQLLDLAQSMVFRAFRVKQIVGGTGPKHLNPPGLKFETGLLGEIPDLDEIDDILPLLPFLNSTFTDTDGDSKPKRPQLIGQWQSRRVGNKDATVVVLDANRNTKPGTIYPDSFSVDAKKGIVTVGEPMTFFDGSSILPAKLFLKCCINANWRGFNKSVYFVLYRDADGLVGSPQLIRTKVRRDVVPKYTAIYSPDMAGVPALNSIVDNKTVVNQELNYYLDAFEQEFEERDGETASYADLLLISPDGAIEQVEYTVTRDGMTTRASRFTRLTLYVPTFAEKQRQAFIDRTRDIVNRAATGEGAIIGVDLVQDGFAV